MSMSFGNPVAEGGLLPAERATVAPAPAARAAGQDADEESRRAAQHTADRFESGPRITEVKTHISVDENSHEPVVCILDARTDEVIREIPPEKIRKMAEFLTQWVGLRMDHRA